MSREQGAGQNHDPKIKNKYFKTVAKLKYLGIILINQNDIYKEIKSRLHSKIFSIILCRTVCFSGCYQKI